MTRPTRLHRLSPAHLSVLLLTALTVLGCTARPQAEEPDPAATGPDLETTAETPRGDQDVAAIPAAEGGQEVAVFAGGCFWCMEPPFDELEGVLATTSGYAGGGMADPSYQQVSSGSTDHLEVIRVLYDPAEVTYEELLEVFWTNVDPLDDGGQFCDRGRQYRTAIFARDDAQRAAAEASKKGIEERLGQRVVTPVRGDDTFYAAEVYHQDYYEKNPMRYKMYRNGCRRDQRLSELWG
jgi:peptide-methionine (S)-S-oxide reductase